MEHGGRNDIYYTILRLRDGVDREEINRQIYKAMQNIILILLMMNGEIFYDATAIARNSSG